MLCNETVWMSSRLMVDWGHMNEMHEEKNETNFLLFFPLFISSLSVVAEQDCSHASEHTLPRVSTYFW